MADYPSIPVQLIQVLDTEPHVAEFVMKLSHYIGWTLRAFFVEVNVSFSKLLRVTSICPGTANFCKTVAEAFISLFISEDKQKYSLKYI